MNIEKVRDDLKMHLGDKATLKCHLGRNKYEEYQVKIKKAYTRIFLVELDNEKKEVKSFSYSDIIAHTIRIKY